MKIQIKKKNGFILPVGIIILLICTLIVLLNSSGTIIQERVTANLQEKQTTLANAEKSLRVAENYVYQNLDTTSAWSAACTSGLCTVSNSTPVWNTLTWTTDTTHTIQLSGSDAITGAYIQPKYIIELFDSLTNSQGESSRLMNNRTVGLAFRITTQAWGSRNGSTVMLQSIYIKR
jgi:type IV pilus assembly protein PilX